MPKKRNKKQMGIKYSKADIVLVALSASTNKSQKYDAVQVQKLLFLIDVNVSKIIGGKKFFNFKPYNYGPFDKDVYIELNSMSDEGLAIKADDKYMLSLSGYNQGKKVFDTLPQNIQEYISEVNKFVTELSFRELVAAIYKKYPEMKKNSIFFGS